MLFFQCRLNELFKSEPTLLFFIVSKGAPKEKKHQPKNAEKVQPNVLIGLFVHFPFKKPRFDRVKMNSIKSDTVECHV